MYCFIDHPDFFNKPIRLNANVEPTKVIDRFFADFSLSELRDILWTWFEAAITSDNDVYSDPEDRATLLYRYRRLEELIEAAFALN
ncbi:MAG: hypothetical protein BGO55_24030 [Sphingobacteriales bacterium 50-39]|nr:hypothetical protein [Sphingobacteriales bacterium]OJW58368.1 MAG: hypothetical protein BGO55_24030 [Sphingobacteriales bacterium 50-39]